MNWVTLLCVISLVSKVKTDENLWKLLEQPLRNKLDNNIYVYVSPRRSKTGIRQDLKDIESIPDLEAMLPKGFDSNKKVKKIWRKPVEDDGSFGNMFKGSRKYGQSSSRKSRTDIEFKPAFRSMLPKVINRNKQEKNIWRSRPKDNDYIDKQMYTRKYGESSLWNDYQKNVLENLLKRRAEDLTPESLPESEPLKPGHTLIRPEQKMLKSAAHYPSSKNAALVYGNQDNIGIRYGDSRYRWLNSDFRKYSEEALQEALRKMNSVKTDGHGTARYAIRRRSDPVVAAFSNYLNEQTRNQQLKDVNYRPWRSSKKYDNDKKKGGFDDFQKINEKIKDDIIQSIKENPDAMNSGSHIVKVVLNPGLNEVQSPYLNLRAVNQILHQKNSLEDGNVGRIDSYELDDRYRRAENETKKLQNEEAEELRLRQEREQLKEQCDQLQSTEEEEESSGEKNPGNPYSVFHNKYKQNWLWNTAMSGDHMNISPYGPQFNNLGPSASALFFGRKWWYFNQDDYKPFR